MADEEMIPEQQPVVLEEAPAFEFVDQASTQQVLLDVLDAIWMADGVNIMTHVVVDFNGSVQTDPFVWNPADPYGLAVQVTQWMADHPEFPIAPYVPPPAPTIEQIRAAMPTLARLDFKTRFKNNGMNLAKITAFIASIVDPSHQEDMQNYYDETPTFSRLSDFVVELAVFSLKTPEQIDTIWTA